jgi:hypothetical protein
MLIIRTSWDEKTDAQKDPTGVQNWLSQEPIRLAQVRGLVLEALDNFGSGAVRFVCRSDEEMGIIHGTLAALGIPQNAVAVPDPPTSENHVLLEEYDAAIVIETHILDLEPEADPTWRRFTRYQLMPWDIPF